MGSKKTKAIKQNWEDLLKPHEEAENKFLAAYESNPEQFRTLSGQGIPTEYRWNVWKTFLGVDARVDDQKYKRLVKQAEEFDEATDTTMRQIVVDVDRTFTWYPYFQKDLNPTGLNKLKRCLKAYSQYDDEIGYTQSMNYVMGFILLVSGGNELETFWFFVSLLEGNKKHFQPGLQQFYTEGFPLYYQFVEHFDGMFETQLPNLKAHFDDLDYYGPVWLQKWFITLFLYSFPLTYCLRIWDNILAEGPIFMFKTIISIISGLESKLLKGDFEKVNDIMSGFNKGLNKVTVKDKNSKLPDLEKLISTAQGLNVTLPDLTATASQHNE